jgi:hypothetical protein
VSALATPQRAMETLFDLDTCAPAVKPEPSALVAPSDAGRDMPVTASGAGVAERPADTADASQAQRGATGGGPRLDDLVAGLWEGLAARRVVECPVCSAEMHPEYGVHALPIGGRCKTCGSTLA